MRSTNSGFVKTSQSRPASLKARSLLGASATTVPRPCQAGVIAYMASARPLLMLIS